MEERSEEFARQEEGGGDGRTVGDCGEGVLQSGQVVECSGGEDLCQGQSLFFLWDKTK